MKIKKKYFLQKGFVSLSVLAVGVLVIASFTLPLIANRLSQRQITQEQAAGSDRCSGIKYKLYIKTGNVAISNLSAVPIYTPLRLEIDRKDGKNCNGNWDNVSLILDIIDTAGAYQFQKSLPIQFPDKTKYTADFSIATAGNYAVRLYVNEEVCQCNELKFTVAPVLGSPTLTPPANQCSVSYTRVGNTNNYVVTAGFGNRYAPGTGRVWLSKKNGTVLGSDKKIKVNDVEIRSYTPSTPKYYLLRTVSLEEGNCTDSSCLIPNFTVEIQEEGEYNLHCDIVKQAAGRCSGDPFCTTGCLSRCSGSDRVALNTGISSTPIPTSPVACSCPAGKINKNKGNANCDEAVDEDDLDIWREELLGIKTTKTADFNCDAKVDGVDFEIWRRNRN